MSQQYLDHLRQEIDKLRDLGLYKSERVLDSSQSTSIVVETDHGRSQVLNFCANNYLGLADNQQIIDAAKTAFEAYGFGMASVRFICGTQTLHKQLESSISRFLGTADTILYSSCFDANTGLFETLLDQQDAIISDALNHASIIDGVRLCKARRLRYRNNDMTDLERQLKQAGDNRFRLIATDGVFSMDGILANLPAICELAEQYDAMVMVDDSHAVGFMGPGGAGTPEHFGVSERIDIYTGTLGKALGGASGGYTSSRAEIISWLRQRSRPYLFSNSLAPSIVAASIRAIELLRESTELREKLRNNSAYFRHGLQSLGYDLLPGEHPIIPVMLGDAKLATEMGARLLAHGIYVLGFSFPVVPEGRARIRTQMSAAHTTEQLDQALSAFEHVGQALGIIN
ncbi:MAG: glycine C-acetyltransferase [Gammaproteobacteria bacterium]